MGVWFGRGNWFLQMLWLVLILGFDDGLATVGFVAMLLCISGVLVGCVGRALRTSMVGLRAYLVLGFGDLPGFYGCLWG